MTAHAPIRRLLDRLAEAGHPVDVVSVADALWLAQWAGPGPGARPRQGVAAAPRQPEVGPPMAAQEPGPETVLLYPPPVRPGSLPPRHIPPPPPPIREALPGLLPLERALRPLRRLRSTVGPVPRALDEEATADLSARAGLLLPVLGPARDVPTLSLNLLFDSSSSMVVWERTVEQVRQVCERSGAFRDVRLLRLHPAPDGGLAIGTRDDPARRARPADELRDPTGRTFTLLVSDCAGPLWRSGAAQRFLHRLASLDAPVAVLQPLPQRLWERTVLRPGPGRLWQGHGPGALPVFRPQDGPPAPGALAVPVLPPSAAALGAWARMLSGAVPEGIRAAAAWVERDHPAVPEPNPQWAPLGAEELMSRFRAGASPAARRLATYLAAVPLVLPLMLTVQRTMLPDGSPSELAEVLLSGLLSHADPAGAGHTVYLGDGAGNMAGVENGPWYDFAPGVRELLLNLLSRDEAALILKLASTHVERAFGAGSPNFPALAVGHLIGTGPAPAARPVPGEPSGPEGVPAPFAAVPALVVRRFLPVTAVRPRTYGTRLAEARALHARYETGGDAGALYQAVAVLRELAADRRGPETDQVTTELGGALLSLWRLGRDPAVLDEAVALMRSCVARLGEGPPAPWLGRAHQTLGRLLRERAGIRSSGHREQEAVESLRQAERTLDRASRLLVPDTDAVLEAVLERAAVLHELWGLIGDDQLLHEAVGGLRAMAGAQSFWAPHTADLHLQLGRVLLTLAATAPADREERRRGYAADAVEELTAARKLLDVEPDGPSRMSALLLDLARARELTGDAGASVPATLEEALRASEYAPATRPTVLTRLGEAWRARFAAGDGDTALARALDFLRRAAGETATGSAERTAVLETLGATLLDLAGSGAPDGLAAVREAVDVLREAVLTTPGTDPGRSERQLLLDRALAVRRRAERAAAEADGAPPG